MRKCIERVVKKKFTEAKCSLSQRCQLVHGCRWVPRTEWVGGGKPVLQGAHPLEDNSIFRRVPLHSPLFSDPSEATNLKKVYNLSRYSVVGCIPCFLPPPYSLPYIPSLNTNESFSRTFEILLPCSCLKFGSDKLV